MKKLYALLMVVLFFAAGCGNNEEGKSPEASSDLLNYDSTEIKTTSLDESSVGTVNLTYKLVKGSTYNFRLTSLADENQTIKADTTIEQKVHQALTYLLSLKVNEVESDGVMEIEFNFKSIKLDATANGKKFTYLSGSKIDSADKERYKEYEAMVNNPFTVRLDAYGEILDIFRADKIVNRILELQGVKDSVTADEKRLFQQDVVDGALKPMVAQIFRKFPKTPVGKDTVWSYSMPPANLQLFTLTSKQNFKLSSFEKFKDDNLAVVIADVTSTYKINDQAKKNNVDVKNPNYTADGKIYFNLSKGLIQKSITSTTMHIQFSVDMPTPKGTKQRVSRSQKTINKNILELL